MTDLMQLANELMRRMEYQSTPTNISDDEYLKIVINGIMDQHILTGRASAFDEALLDYDTNSYDAVFGIDELEFILLSSQISLLEKVQAGVNTQVSYTTDALSIAKADVPYKNLSGTIAELKNRRRVIYYKMTSYIMEQ